MLKEILDELGDGGVKNLATILTGDHHNRQVAKDFGLTLWQVRVCNQFLPELCHYVLTIKDKQQAMILPFKQRSAA